MSVFRSATSKQRGFSTPAIIACPSETLLHTSIKSVTVFCFVALSLGSNLVIGETFPAKLGSLVKKHCAGCHGPDAQEGDFRIDTLARDVAGGGDADHWHEALNRINNGEMPPEDAPQLSDREFADLTAWLTQQLEIAARARRQTDGQVIFRRLNRDEYNNTLNDLFGIDLDVKQLLPPERVSEDGFTNNGGELVMSPLHFESFLKIARLYLDRSLIKDPDSRPDRSGFAVEFERDGNGRPRAAGQTLAKDASAVKFPVGTYPNIDPRNKKRGKFNGEIREKSVVLPPATRAKGTQIPARRGPQPRIEIPLKTFPDSGVVRVKVKARTVPGIIQRNGGLQVEVYELLPDCKIESFAGKQPTRVLFSDGFDLKDLGISIEKTSLKFTTQLRVPTSGEYQFFTSADDGSRLYINGEQVVDGERVNEESTGAIELKAGLHKLVLTYHDTGGGERLNVEWKGPKLKRQAIPSDALVSALDPVRGDAPIEVQVHPLLTDTALASYAGSQPLETRYTSELDIHRLGIEIEKISLRFRAMLEVPIEGTYTFHTRADDGATIYVDRKQVAHNRGGGVPVQLTAGTHELIVTYYDTGGGDQLTVQWEAPDLKRGPIGAQFLSRPEPEKVVDPPENQKKTSAYLSVMVANRLDDGVEFKPISRSLEVKATDEPDTYEFIGRMENLPLPIRSRTGVSGDLTDARLFLLNRWEPAYPSGPNLEIFSVEFEAPVHDQWPPESHRKIMCSEDPEELLENFLSRAFRRPPTKEEVQGFLNLWKEYASENPEASDVELAAAVLPAVLISPSFLYLVEPQASDGVVRDQGSESRRSPLDDHELAKRLAYFLTRSMPDARLRGLADAGRLRHTGVLRQETRRLLQSAESDQFVAGFVDQWLDLEALERIPVERKRHPTYQPWLREAMRQETRGWFATVMREQRSALELIDSNSIYVNPVLADHYGIPGVSGTEFRVVGVPQNSHRGGLLTQASFLTGNSNGVDSHPIKRGVWLLDRLLNDPPPPPPPNVPELDSEGPGLKGKTLKEQLAIHRDVQACRNCHQRIDPFGLPFESFNTVGQWRDSDDTKTVLPDGATVDGIDELKRYLVANRKDDFAEALGRKLFAWGLGRSLSFSDDTEVNAITEEFRKADYRIIPLIESIVTSDSFTHH